jgi:ubiquitin-protein ligase
VFKVRVTFLDGYPFRPPTCIFSNRIFNPNFMTLYDGTSCLPHLQRMWNNTWSMKKLLEHIVSLLITPDLSFVEERLLYIAKCYAWTKEDERRG